MNAKYEFTVLKDSKPAGFVLTSASYRYMPILECGAGKAPSTLLSVAIQSASDQKIIVSSEAISPRFYYWGALTYSVQLNKQMQDQGLCIDLMSGSVEKLPSTMPELKFDRATVHSAWDKIEQSQGYSLLYTERTLSGMPAYYQHTGTCSCCDAGNDRYAQYPYYVGAAADPWDYWDGCAPIAGSMVLGYWQSHGYSSISTDDEVLIDWCHLYMGTSLDGVTNASNVGPGIAAVASLYGYSFSYAQVDAPSWSSIKSEINSSRPFVLTMDTYGFGHFVAGYGYYEDTLMDYYMIRVFTTWDTTWQYIEYGDWSYCGITKIYPG